MTSPDPNKVLILDPMEMTKDMIEERMRNSMEPEGTDKDEAPRGWAANRYQELVRKWTNPFSGKHSAARAERAKAKARKRRR